MSVPVDTKGFPMPPPCLAGEREGVHESRWEEWWRAYLSNGLPSECPCCVCGCWFVQCQVTPCKRALLHRKALEVLNSTLSEIYICRQCKTTCPKCKGTITRFQRERFDGCELCTP